MPTRTISLEPEAAEVSTISARLEYLMHDTTLSTEAMVAMLANLSAKRCYNATTETGYDMVRLFDDVFMAVLEACDNGDIDSRCGCVMCRNIRATRQPNGDSDALDS